MPGELARAQMRGRGPMGEAGLGAKQTRFVLPIFREPVFIGHKVLNPDFVAGRKRGSFDGEDSYGWGLHQTGVIDCVNLSPNICSGGFSLKVDQNWETLWNMEHQSGELAEDFLKRVIIQIRLDPNSVKRIPDPAMWNLEVVSSSGNDIQQTTVGKLILKSKPLEGLEKFRTDMYSARSSKIDFEGPWVTNK
jgi:hypothetical protein